MENPIITYRDNLLAPGNMNQEMTKRFLDLYVLNIRPKTDFLETDEETKVIQFGKFLPGKIYTFKYDPLYKNKLDFFDKRPVILCNQVFFAKGTKNLILSGLNLNFLPEEIVAQLLSKFYELFDKEIDLSYNMAGSNNVNFDIREIAMFFKEWKEVLAYFGGLNGLGYQFAYRHYIIDRIEFLRYVEYQHWEMLPFLMTEEIEGKSVKEIYTLYWKTLISNVNKSKKR